MQEKLVQQNSGPHQTNGVHERGTRTADKGHSIIHTRFANSFQLSERVIHSIRFSISGKYTKDSSGEPLNREHVSANGSSPSLTTVTMSRHEKYEAKKSIVILIAIFVISLIAMFYVYLMFPELES